MTTNVLEHVVRWFIARGSLSSLAELDRALSGEVTRVLCARFGVRDPIEAMLTPTWASSNQKAMVV